MYIYTVKRGDTLYSIARQFGVSPQSLINSNRLPDPNRLAVGQTVVVDVSDKYLVKSGDSLYSIALSSGIPLGDLISANPEISPPFNIYPDTYINLPEADKKEISVLGYVETTTSANILSLSLPYLTYLAIFSYTVDTSGNISGPDDTAMINLALNSGVAPLLVVTNTVEGEGFDSDLVGAVINDTAAKQNLISNLVKVCKQKGYYGVNVDFEYVYPYDRSSYNTFLSELSESLSENGLILSTALAPKQSSSQVGTLYEAHDYPYHGSVVDFTVLMTYEWGYTYGPPLAVAPYDQVRKVISYAVTEIPSQKILMGMPNYGYDWTLPYRRGTAARALTINGAMKLASDTGSVIQFSESSQAPFFEYTQNGQNHIVWFENALSTKARLNLVNDFNLGGVAYWTVNSFYAQNWLVLSSMFDIKKIV